MGFLDDYDVDLDEFNESGFSDPDPGTYSFEVLRGELRKGTSSDENAVNIVVQFQLENEDGEAQTWSWWLKVPDDPDRPSRRESISMSDWKKWLLGAGFEPAEINSVGPDDIEGISGTVRMVHTRGKGDKKDNIYVNAKDWTFDGAEEEDVTPPPARATKAKASKPKPAPEPEEDEDEEGTPTTSRRRKGNPFEKSK